VGRAGTTRKVDQLDQAEMRDVSIRLVRALEIDVSSYLEEIRPKPSTE
jgi:hypothetical protein